MTYVEHRFPTFYGQLIRQYSFDQKIQTQTVGGKNLLKILFYE